MIAESRSILLRRPIEVVQVETLSALRVLLARVQSGAEEEARERRPLSPLERAILNAYFVLDEVSPLVDELFGRSSWRLTLAQDFLGRSRIEFNSYSFVANGAVLSTEGARPENAEDDLQQQWDRNEGGDRRSITKFGFLSKAELVAKFARRVG